jgi:hypothetical protein
MSQLVFRTPDGGLSIHSGITELGVVDISAFSKIRILARPRFFIGGARLNLLLQSIEGSDVSFTISKLDLLAPALTPTEVYDVPGKTLKIIAEAEFQNPQDTILTDILIYGN